MAPGHLIKLKGIQKLPTFVDPDFKKPGIIDFLIEMDIYSQLVLSGFMSASDSDVKLC